MKITYSEALKDIRKEAKECGLTFKQQNAYINGMQAYKFINRSTGQDVISNCTLWSAYENVQSGYVAEHRIAA